MATHLRFCGRPFQSLGATERKALSPPETRLLRGTFNKVASLAEQLPLGGSYFVSNSDRYSGAVPFTHLKTIVKYLYSLRRVIGSQCRSAKTGVMCSLLLVNVRHLAAALILNFLQFTHDCLRQPV